MFAFYLQESSFQWILVSEIEQVLNSINEIIVTSNSLDNFYQYKDITCVRSSIYRKNIYDILMTSPKTQHLLYKVLPYISKRIHFGYGPYRNLVQFQKMVNKSTHAFLGGKFINKKDYELTTLEEFLNFRKSIFTENINRVNFESYYKNLFPNLTLLEDALDSIKSFVFFNDLVDVLCKLQEYICGNGDMDFYTIAKTTGLNISDESDTTKKNPSFKRFRLFTIPNIGKTYCYIHIKINQQYRMHIHIDIKQKHIYIPYVGNHLPTAKYH